MSGFGYVLAGLAQGAGAGIAKKGELDMQAAEKAKDRDFQTALENLRSQNNMTETRNQYDLADRNDARGTARDTDSRIVVAKTEGQIRGELGKEEDARRFAHDRAMALLGGQIERTNAEAKAALEAGTVVDSTTDASGEVILFVKGKPGENPKRLRTGVTEAPSTSSGGGGSLIDQTRGLGGATAPARPAAQQSGKATQPQYRFNPTTGELELVKAK